MSKFKKELKIKNKLVILIAIIISIITIGTIVIFTPKEKRETIISRVSLNNQKEYQETAIIDGITWNYTLENGKATNIKPSDKSLLEGRIIIPSELDGYQVTSIGYQAFLMCTELTSIEIPNGVISIGDMAFYNCTGLTSINIPYSVENIGKQAFSICTGLTSIIVDESNQNYCSLDGILYNKDKTILIQCPGGRIGVVTILDGVESIGDYSFFDCSRLTNINIPNSVISIGEGSFENCKGLTEMIIPYGVTEIGFAAFANDDSITMIVIPDSVSNIGNLAFDDCISLKKLTMPGTIKIETLIFNNVTNVEEVILTGEGEMHDFLLIKGINENNHIFTPWFQSREKFRSLTIGDKITKIGRYAFCGCKSLTNVSIGNSVISIGESAFTNCTSLISIEIPDSVTSIGNSAFANCTGLISMEIPDSVTSIGNSAFYECTGLTSVNIPNSVTSIGERAFENCTGLINLEIPDSVTSIEESAFYKCSSLKKITIPGTSTIGEFAFLGVSNVEEVILTGEGAIPDYTSPNSIPWAGKRRYKKNYNRR